MENKLALALFFGILIGCATTRIAQVAPVDAQMQPTYPTTAPRVAQQYEFTCTSIRDGNHHMTLQRLGQVGFTYSHYTQTEHCWVRPMR